MFSFQGTTVSLHKNTFEKLIQFLKTILEPSSRAPGKATAFLGKRSNSEAIRLLLLATKPFSVARCDVVEMRRVELLTPCLQGRCSPN